MLFLILRQKNRCQPAIKDIFTIQGLKAVQVSVTESKSVNRIMMGAAC